MIHEHQSFGFCDFIENAKNEWEHVDVSRARLPKEIQVYILVS